MKTECRHDVGSTDGTLLYDSKRLLGKSFEEYNLWLKNESKYWPFEVVEKDGLVQMVVPSPLNVEEREGFYPEEISALVLRKLIKIFKAKFQTMPLGKIVVTIPVDFINSTPPWIAVFVIKS